MLETKEILLIICAVIVILIGVLYHLFKNPYEYPYFRYTFDVSSKRNVKIEDYIDRFILDKNNRKLLVAHEKKIRKWKANVEEELRESKMQKYRRQQYEEVLDDARAYRFYTVRRQTRYQQQNYEKTSYHVYVNDSGCAVSWAWLTERQQKLKAIDYECTLSEYARKKQRSLMTPALRHKIMLRDNYTCKLCGKYMPDEVGLQIDHIVPVAKGGKSVPSNLRVLCSKCNGKKGAK